MHISQSIESDKFFWSFSSAVESPFLSVNSKGESNNDQCFVLSIILQSLKNSLDKMVGWLRSRKFDHRDCMYTKCLREFMWL